MIAENFFSETFVFSHVYTRQLQKQGFHTWTFSCPEQEKLASVKMNKEMETMENITLLSHSCYVFCW